MTYRDGSERGEADVDQCQCLFHPVTQADSENDDHSDQDSGPIDQTAVAIDPGTLSLWMEKLEEEAGQMDGRMS
jgi:hypothetical protein